ncbi:MAG: GNAT family N-acetyltransferase [Pirellulales bacterium]
MTDEYCFEPMTLADYDDVLALWRATEGMSRLETRDELARYLERNPGLSVVVRQDGAIVAAVLAGHDGHRGYLYHLAVAAAHRGRGLARRLVDRCLVALADLGLPRCGLQVYRDNPTGLEFWSHLGWTRRDDVQPFTRDLPP